ncbi:MAG TPA: SDR family oxidoreductase [Cyclobacteriaceae bacterium]|nr:SDR family oxidoreductase [Cyclobacteriaceae bacterium]
MKILLTGSTGYIGRRLLPVLLDDGHEVVCLVRDRRRFDYEDFTDELLKRVQVIEADLQDENSLLNIPKDIDIAFYLVHSMSGSYQNFHEAEKTSAVNFAAYVKQTRAKQIIYLGGIANDKNLSEHLQSRKNVEQILASSGVAVTVLRAAIIIGSGSASFEIIRDLVEKLPVMIAPRWLKSKCQPIAIRNVIDYLKGVMLKEEAYHQSFDIGGPDVLSYYDMLMGFAQARKLKRLIITVPVLTPKLSSLWLYFVTATSYSLSRSLVDSMINEVVCADNRIQQIVPVKLYSYQEALHMAFDKIRQQMVVSSWKDAISNPQFDKNFLNYIQVPEHGCLFDKRTVNFQHNFQGVIESIWRIGGDNGWYYGNILWKLRGILDKVVGGVGLRRGRRSASDLKAGDALDFWRVLLADKENGRLLLYAEMKLPGDAWLEFKVKKEKDFNQLVQTATFRPLGLWGRLYWYLVLPFHGLIFPGMARNIVKRGLLLS